MYTIRTRPYAYFTGTTNHGKQVLLGWVNDFIGVIIFDETGNLLETREYPIGIDPKKGLGPAVESIVAKQIRVVKRLLSFHNGPIQVNPFFIERWDVGLKQFPMDLEEFLARPEECPAEDAHFWSRDIEEWIRDGNCVLDWGNDYLIGRDGETL